MNITSIQRPITDSLEVKKSILGDESLLLKVLDLAEECLASLKEGKKIIFCGNGGSFADAQHLSAEFTSRFMFDRKSLPSLALGTNASAMSAIANDYGYEFVFSREVESVAEVGDVIVVFSTSGNSPNILRAVEAGKEKGIKIWGMTGESGGELSRTGIICINIPSNDTARIQEMHIMLGHVVCELVEADYFGR